jgi:hypothetical protein
MSNESNQSAPQKLSASQRLENLENGLASLFQLNDKLIKDVTDVSKALQLLNNKVNAITQASLAGEQPSDEVLDRIMSQNNVDDLSKKVSDLVQQGFLVSEEEISDNAFVVGQELEISGSGEEKVVNLRLQFAVKTLNPEVQAKLLGSKIGQKVEINKNLKFLVSESYRIQSPQAPAPEATPEVAVTDTSATSESTPAQSN